MIKKQNVFPESCLRYYKDALYSCLVQLKPVNCLEIGSHFGGTAEVFQSYFDEFCPDGLLLTGDVFEYTKLDYKNVRQILLQSHLPHDELVKAHDLIKSPVQYSENSKYINNIRYWTALQKAKRVNKFDFAFIDGDHSLVSFKKDFEMCLDLVKTGGYILIDDIPSDYECSKYYYETIKNDTKYINYEFGDWNSTVGAVLLQITKV